MAKKNKNRNPVISTIRRPKQLNREVKARVRLKYGEVGRALRGDLRASRQQSRNYNQWYRQYRQGIAAAQRDSQGAFNQLSDQAAQRDRASQDRYEANQRQVADEEARSAALRGVQGDTSNMSRDAEADSQRQALRDSYANRTGEMGASSRNLLNTIRASSAAGQAADQRNERNVRLGIREKQRELKRDKGAERVAIRGDIRREERDWVIQNRTLKQKDRYTDAVNRQSRLGYAGKVASANATVRAAQLYSGAKIEAAKIYNTGNGQKVKGKDVMRASGYLRAEMKKQGLGWRAVKRNSSAWRAKLIDRGADPVAAKVAVRRLLANKQRKIGSRGWAEEKKKRNGKGRR